MSRDNFIGYLLHALNDDETREVEAAIHRTPRARHELTLLRESVRPLEFDRDTIEPPPDLIVNTLALVAQHIVETEGRAPGTDATPVADLIRGLKSQGPILPSTTFPSESLEFDGPNWKRGNVIALAGLAVALFALVLPGIVFLRDRQNVLACEQKLSTLHQSLMTYADTFGGTLPRVGEGETGSSFVSTLQRNGLLPTDLPLVCPAAPSSTASPRSIDFAYNFGYRDSEGSLVSLRRDDQNGETAIMADAPTPGMSRCLSEPKPVNHSRGQNVLFLNGSVRFCSNATLGTDDNIFCNQNRQIKAGVHHDDVMLGRGDEVP